MITLRNVTFGYRRHEVFRGLTLDFRSGHIHALLGRNGVGKSTLLKLCAGLLTPSGGEISVAGHNPAKHGVALFREIFHLPEEAALPDIAIERFAKVDGAFYPNFSQPKFSTLCDSFGIDLSRKPLQLSMGERKKATIAFALAANTPLVLMDEPTNGLDIPSKVTLRRLLADEASTGRTVVIATHQIREVEPVIDHLTICDTEGLVLSESVDTLAARLKFGTLNPGDTVLYEERNSVVPVGITANRTGEDLRPDLEMLFTALAADRKTIPDHLKTYCHER